MKNKSEKYARDTVAMMRKSGFGHYESERIRPYLENAYLAGYKAGRSGRAKGSPITEDIILKNAEQ